MKKHTNSSCSLIQLLRVAFTILLLGCVQTSPASQLRLTTVSQPLYMHSDSDPVITITQVPYVTFHADPEWRFPAIATPFIPPTSNPQPGTDVNLVSVYRIAAGGSLSIEPKLPCPPSNG